MRCKRLAQHLVFFLTFAASIIILPGYTSTALAAQGQRPPTPVETAPVRVGQATSEARVVGSLLANEAATIRPEIAGLILEIHFKEGDSVEQGTLLVTLDPLELQARLDRSSAERELAKLKFDRARDLYERKKLVSAQDYDEASATLKQAEAQQRLDEVRLGKTRLSAPFNGSLGLRRVSPGDYVEAGDAIVDVTSTNPIKLEFRLPEKYTHWVKVGDNVTIRVDALPQQQFPGTIYAIDPSLDTRTRTLLIRAKLENPEARLHPGMFARVSVELAKRDQALWIPEQALVPRGEKQFVYRLLDGKSALTEVTTGQRLAGEVEIVQGLDATETIITAGHQKIGDGSPVKSVPETEAKAEVR